MSDEFTLETKSSVKVTKLLLLVTPGHEISRVCIFQPLVRKASKLNCITKCCTKNKNPLHLLPFKRA